MSNQAAHVCPVAQSEASPTADPGVVSLVPAQSHTFVELDHEIIFMGILLLQLNQEGLLSVTRKNMCKKYMVNCLVKLAQEKVWLGELTVLP